MFKIVIMACKLASGEPELCKEFQVQLYSDYNVTQSQCITYSMVEVPKWASEHPEWTVKKWHCDIPKEHSKLEQEL